MISNTRSGVAYNVKAEDNYAYLTNNDGVMIFDISEPDSPREVCRVRTDCFTLGIAVKNSTAYVACEKGLFITDVSNPAYPDELGEYGKVNGGWKSTGLNRASRNRKRQASHFSLFSERRKG